MSEDESIRSQLLSEVAWFLERACRIDGVERIALVGSLATSKEDPKDCDLLVTIREDVDLESLAALGRRIQGHAQSLGGGADVFLADRQHRYLGRTCPWRRCGPGIRVRCDALHCGRREYLHDDLETVTLETGLIESPPVILWPEVQVSGAAPADLDELVLGPARGLAPR